MSRHHATCERCGSGFAIRCRSEVTGRASWACLRHYIPVWRRLRGLTA